MGRSDNAYLALRAMFAFLPFVTMLFYYLSLQITSVGESESADRNTDYVVITGTTRTGCKEETNDK